MDAVLTRAPADDMRIVPVSITEARAFVEKHHKHHHAPPGASFAVGVACLGRLVCVALVGRPISPELDADPTIAELTRGASDGSTWGAASLCTRTAGEAAVLLGYRRVVSYTLLGERGTSYRKAGWRVTGLRVYAPTAVGWNNRPGRAPTSQVSRHPKVRWEYGPDALPKDKLAWSALWKHAGTVDFEPRPENLPLLARAAVKTAEVVGE